MSFKEKYGPVALVAGASEGLGAAWCHALAKRGLDVVLVARRLEPLEKLANEIAQQYGVKTTAISLDLNDADVIEKLSTQLGSTEISFMVYNAALPYIGKYLDLPVAEHVKIAQVNVVGPLKMAHYFGGKMVARGKGGIVLMASLAGFQGSGFLSTYASTKAFNRVLAESLWYEWKDLGVDVIGCCAGATATPNYINTKPKDAGMFAPKVQLPEEVAEECMHKIGTVPSFVTGAGNRFASFMMNTLFSRKIAVTLMGDTTRKMYNIK